MNNKEIAIIAAWGKDNRIIGYNGGIPWNVPEDRKHQKEITMDRTLIMGPATYRSIPQKLRPLVGRESIVVSSKMNKEDYPGEDFKIVRTIEEALECATREKIFFYGGQQIYEAGMKYATTIHGTVVDYDGPGDRYFPKIGKEWNSVNGTTVNDFLVSTSGVRYTFITLQKN